MRVHVIPHDPFWPIPEKAQSRKDPSHEAREFAGLKTSSQYRSTRVLYGIVISTCIYPYVKWVFFLTQHKLDINQQGIQDLTPQECLSRTYNKEI